MGERGDRLPGGGVELPQVHIFAGEDAAVGRDREHDPLRDLSVVFAGKRAQVELARLDSFRDLLRRACSVRDHRVAEPVRDPTPELVLIAHVVHEHVRKRHLEVVRAVYSEQPSDRPLDRDGRLARDLLRDARGDPRGGCMTRLYGTLIEAELAHRSSRTIGKGITSRSVSRSVRIITSRSTPMPPPAVGE